MNSQNNAFKALPSVDKALQSDSLRTLVKSLGHEPVKEAIREKLNEVRSGIADADEQLIQAIRSEDYIDEFCKDVAERVKKSFSSSLVPVINLTGTVVHTNLGRARLPKEAIDAIETVATQATNLEFDLVTGKRGDRDAHIENSICQLTGAEAATVVNNNAAAVLLVLNTLAQGKEVIISRGELVEIGGAFRIPDVMKSAGCTLREIGTTNRTHLRDYESAISSNTGLLMKVHTSNYEIRGFTNSVSEEEISQLAQVKELAFVSDLGSGTLVDLTQFGLPHEPTVSETLEQGADIVTFSGDKLLGGPQAGIIVGKKELVAAIKKNPLKRALRVDKITMAALSEIISLYRDPHRLAQRIPLLADLARPLEEINEVAERLLPKFSKKLDGLAEVRIEDCKSQIGSGALPLDLLKSKAIVIQPIAGKGQNDAELQKIAADFRQLPVPIIGRIHDGKLIFDLRCLRDEDEVTSQLSMLRNYAVTD
ncbi:MAG: L-seryl-tRNA(Sec) selenium transferase [Pseudomonadales bacterium]|nr:L-seryl-tRNA(Sec) selenium transferase [Pseudomonadales bacterium]